MEEATRRGEEKKIGNYYFEFVCMCECVLTRSAGWLAAAAAFLEGRKVCEMHSRSIITDSSSAR